MNPVRQNQYANTEIVGAQFIAPSHDNRGTNSGAMKRAPTVGGAVRVDLDRASA